MAITDTINLSIVSPAKALFEGQVNGVQVPGHDGLMGIQPGHAPLLALLGSGLMTVRTETGSIDQYVVEGGFVEVSDNRVTVLANAADRVQEVNVEEARKEFEELQEKMVSGDEAIDRKLAKTDTLRVKIKYGKEGPGSES